MKTAIIKYNAGNIRSVYFALKRLGISVEITDDPETIRKADKVVFPGVGEASSTMKFLREKQFDELIPVLRQPVLAVCLGMQLLCSESEEGNATGLGVVDAEVKRFPSYYKVPHMGWNRIHRLNSPIFKDVPEGSFVYFVHSYYVPASSFSSAISGYGMPFSAALQKDNFFATQFHPEKSGSIGSQILQNFISL
jgi:glutamine amidotransferase